MNRLCYRLIFNRRRGVLMAVAESAQANAGGASGESRDGGGRHRSDRSIEATLLPLRFALWSALGLIAWPAGAQIVADPTAAAVQRPNVMAAGNGVPVVNIQTPSAAGVSRNVYSQFDVGQAGAILNNSRDNVQTQQAGWVAGNPWLAGGSARIILNEVNSSDPSRLNGYVEVAGQRAQVVIANPAGITCDGCGFINAERATLTTGRPLLEGGALTGYRIEGGLITVQGSGLDSRGVDYTDLIARGVQINAGLWAQRLAVTAGANLVDAANATATPITGQGAAPAFAIDVAQLGGMYAGRIVLVGSEAGLGVRNAGQIGASAGEIAIRVDGRLENRGEIKTPGALSIAAAAVDNQADGKIYGAQSINLQAAGDLVNRGTVDGGDVLIAAGGQLSNLGGGQLFGDRLALAANRLVQAPENGAAPVIAARQGLNIGVDELINTDNASILSLGNLAIGGRLDNGVAAGQASRVDNASASIEAMGDLTIDARQIDNRDTHVQTWTYDYAPESFFEYQGAGSPNRYANGTPGVYVYNDESDHLATPEGNYETWYRYLYTRTVSETRIADAAPARIQSGGAMRLHADRLHNAQSHVVAGGALDAAVVALVNESIDGERVSTDSGTVEQFWRDHHKGRDSTGSSSSAYTPAQVIESLSLVAAVVDQNNAPSLVGSAPGSLPGSALYHYNLSPSAGYLVETDPAFANYRQWLSSDYLLGLLNGDPAALQKRLGDGFYEQRLLSEQIGQLTGRRFLAGYASDEAQYRALMDNAATQAQQFGFQVGIALTAAQVAQLTSDIVWLVERDVTLPDGSVQKALVPQIYARLGEGDLAASGSLTAGGALNLAVTQTLENRGLLAGSSVTAVAETLRNLGGRIVGDTVSLGATGDLTVEGGEIAARDGLTVQAGHDLKISSTTRTQTNGQGSVTNLDRLASLYVSTGDLTLSAGNDLTVLGAVLKNTTADGQTVLVAGNDLTLGTVDLARQQKNSWEGNNWQQEAVRSVQGSSVSGAGDVTAVAGNDLTVRASNVEAGGTALLAAGNDVAIVAGRETVAVDAQAEHTGTSGGGSKRQQRERWGLDSSQAVASTVSGRQVDVQAGQDAILEAARVSAEERLKITAARDVSIVSAENERSTSHEQLVKKALGLSRKMERDTRDTLSVRQQGSELSGAEVAITAGQDLTLLASGIEAGGAVDLRAGREIAYLAGTNLDEERETHERRNNLLSQLNQSGLIDNGWQKFKEKSESTTTTRTAAVTQVQTPGEVLSQSGGDTTLAGTRIRAGSFTAIAGSVDGESVDPTAQIRLLGVKESHSETQSSSGRSVMWQSMRDRGETKESLLLPDIQGYGAGQNAPSLSAGEIKQGATTADNASSSETPPQVALIAPGGLTVGATDLPSTQVEAGRSGGGNGSGPETRAVDLRAQAKMLAQQPGLAWLGELADRPDVDWQKVELINQQWDHKQSGLTQEGGIIIAVVVTIVTWGAAAEAGAAVAAEAGMTTTTVVNGVATTTLTATGSAVATATAAGLTTLASQAAVSLVNNKGDIGKTLKDLGSNENVKQLVTSMLTAGALNAVGGTSWMQQFNKGTGITDRLVTNLVNSAVSATIYTAVQGGDYAETLKAALLTGGINAAAGWASGQVGNWYSGDGELAGKYLAHKVAHALVGCAGAAAKGGDCASGAIGAAVGETFAEFYGDLASPVMSDADRMRLLNLAGLVAMAAAKVTGNDMTAAGDAAGIAVANNYLAHAEAKALADAKARRDQCQNKACADAADREIKALQDLDRANNEALKTACQVTSSAACTQAMLKLADAVASYAGQKDGWDPYSIIDKERSEAITLANQYSIKATKAAEILRSVGDIALDFSPAGDAKALLEAQTKLDYALALVGVLGPAGDAAKALIKEAKLLAEAGEGVKAAERLSEAEKTLTAAAGSKNNWDKVINGQLEAKATYQLDNGHKYITDSNGRVSVVEGQLSLTTMDRNTYQQCATGKCGNVGDEGGHLIASSLGGAGDRINIVPQAATLNRGDWKAMENELRTALQEGKSVSVKIDVGYPAGGGVRPDQFFVVATIDGKIKEFPFRQ